jgi:hypothetical protein
LHASSGCPPPALKKPSAASKRAWHAREAFIHDVKDAGKLAHLAWTPTAWALVEAIRRIRATTCPKQNTVAARFRLQESIHVNDARPA